MLGLTHPSTSITPSRNCSLSSGRIASRWRRRFQRPSLARNSGTLYRRLRSRSEPSGRASTAHANVLQTCRAAGANILLTLDRRNQRETGRNGHTDPANRGVSPRFASPRRQLAISGRTVKVGFAMRSAPAVPNAVLIPRPYRPSRRWRPAVCHRERPYGELSTSGAPRSLEPDPGERMK